MITDFSSLQTAIAAWTHRTDLTSVIPDFIGMAEKRMQVDLKVSELEKTGTITTTSGNNTVSLPSDFSTLIAASLDSGGQTITLDSMPLHVLLGQYGNSSTGTPHSYALLNNSLVLGPTPAGALTITVRYSSNIPALSVSNTTNDVLTKYPDLYLNCCMVFAALFLQDDGLLQRYESAYQQAINAINNAEWGRNSPMTMKAA